MSGLIRFTDDRLAPEFIGKAKMLRKRVTESFYEADSVMRAANREFSARADRKPEAAPRKEMCLQITQRLQAVGQFGRFSAYSKTVKKNFELFDHRLVPSSFSDEQWGNDVKEPGISLEILSLRYVLDDEYRSVIRETVSVAAISLHALARFYQRAFVASDRGLCESLFEILPVVIKKKREELANDIIINEEEVEEMHIETKIGTWRGKYLPIEFRDRQIMCFMARTFV